MWTERFQGYQTYSSRNCMQGQKCQIVSMACVEASVVGNSSGLQRGAKLDAAARPISRLGMVATKTNSGADGCKLSCMHTKIRDHRLFIIFSRCNTANLPLVADNPSNGMDAAAQRPMSRRVIVVSNAPSRDRWRLEGRHIATYVP